MKKVVGLYYAFQVFFTLLVWVPIFYVIQKSSGLTDTQIFFIQTCYHLLFSVFEIPTGSLADKFGLRKIMLAGAMTLCLANIVPLVNSHYIGFFLHFMLISLSRSLVSGSASAYLYEYLAEQKSESEYKKIEGRARSYSLLVRIVVWASAGYLMKLSLLLPYAITAINALIAFFMATQMPDILAQKNKTKQFNFRDFFKSLQNSPLLFVLILQGASIFVLQKIALVQLFQPLLTFQGFAVVHFGIIMSVITIFESLGSYLAPYIQKMMSDRTAVFILSFAIIAAFFAASIPSKILSVFFLCLFSLFIGLAFPIQKQILNDNISENQFRATYLSLESLMDRLICSFLIYFIGSNLTSHDIKGAFVFCAVSMCLIHILVFLYIVRHNRKIT